MFFNNSAYFEGSLEGGKTQLAEILSEGVINLFSILARYSCIIHDRESTKIEVIILGNAGAEKISLHLVQDPKFESHI